MESPQSATTLPSNRESRILGAKYVLGAWLFALPKEALHVGPLPMPLPCSLYSSRGTQIFISNGHLDTMLMSWVPFYLLRSLISFDPFPFRFKMHLICCWVQNLATDYSRSNSCSVWPHARLCLASVETQDRPPETTIASLFSVPTLTYELQNQSLHPTRRKGNCRTRPLLLVFGPSFFSRSAHSAKESSSLCDKEAKECKNETEDVVKLLTLHINFCKIVHCWQDGNEARAVRCPPNWGCCSDCWILWCRDPLSVCCCLFQSQSTFPPSSFWLISFLVSKIRNCASAKLFGWLCSRRITLKSAFYQSKSIIWISKLDWSITSILTGRSTHGHHTWQSERRNGNTHKSSRIERS